MSFVADNRLKPNINILVANKKKTGLKNHTKATCKVSKYGFK